MIKAVIQEERTGCGIASAAAIAGIRYKEARADANALGIYAEDQRLWSETAHVRRLLAHYGFKTMSTETPFRSWEALPDLALLAIKWYKVKGRPFWHWVVFVRENGCACVLDSKRELQSQIRTDFGRMKPKWFLEANRSQHRIDRK